MSSRHVLGGRRAGLAENRIEIDISQVTSRQIETDSTSFYLYPALMDFNLQIWKSAASNLFNL